MVASATVVTLAAALCSQSAQAGATLRLAAPTDRAALTGLAVRYAALSWGTIGGIRVGSAQAALIHKRGPGVRYNKPCPICVDLRWYGPVLVEFKHRRVVRLDCAATGPLAGRGCPHGFVLPDGVALGTPVPRQTRWHGYVTYVPMTGAQYDFIYWRRSVRVGHRAIWVSLVVEKGRVIGITEALGA